MVKITRRETNYRNYVYFFFVDITSKRPGMESGSGAALLVLVEKLTMTETTCKGFTINGAIICTSHLLGQANTIHVRN